jgi:hypothetical protein
VGLVAGSPQGLVGHHVLSTRCGWVRVTQVSWKASSGFSAWKVETCRCFLKTCIAVWLEPLIP